MKIRHYKKEYLILLAIFVAAFLLRLYFALNNEIITELGVYYLDLAKNLILNKAYVSNYLDSIFLYDTIPFYELVYPPVFPLLITISFFLFGTGFFQAKLVAIISGSILVIATYFFTKRFLNKQIALFSSILVAFFLVLITFSSVVLPETLIMLLIMVSFYTLLKSRKNNIAIIFFISAIFYSLSILTKTYMALFFPLFILALILEKRRINLKLLLVFAFTVILIVSPWIIYTYTQGTSESHPLMIFIPTNIVSEKNNHLDVQEFYTRSGTPPNEIIKQTLKHITIKEYFLTSFKNAFISLFFITPIVVPLLFFIFGLIGMILYYIQYRKNWIILFFFIFVYYLCSVVPADSERYIILLVPFYFIFLAFMLFKLVGWISHLFKFKEQKIYYLLIFGISIFLIFSNLKDISFSPTEELLFQEDKQDISLSPLGEKVGYWRFLYSGEPEFWVETGRMINQLSNSSTIISSFHPQIAYYADTRWVATPYTDYDSFISILKKFNTNYLILYEYDTNFHPGIKFLLEANVSSSEDLELIFFNEAYNLKIFKIL